MKRVRFQTVLGAKNFDSRAAAALAVTQCLMKAGNNGLKIEEVLQEVRRSGVQAKGGDGKSGLSNLLQELMEIGVVRHPYDEGGSHHYVFGRWPEIVPA